MYITIKVTVLASGNAGVKNGLTGSWSANGETIKVNGKFKTAWELQG